jgi:hypothetical protein
MYACYGFTLLTYTSVVATGLQAIFDFRIFDAPHPTVAFLTTIIYLFTQVLIIFFFIGTATSVREYVQEHRAADAERAAARDVLAAQAKLLRGRVSGHIYLHILLFMAQSIVGGAVVAQAAPGWIHTILVTGAFIYYHYVVLQQHRGFRTMTGIVVGVTGAAADGQQPELR